MRIRDHLLEGNNIDRRDTPNIGGPIEPRYLVYHFTAGRNAKSAVSWLCNRRAKASAHLVVARDGGITQLAPFNIKNWHAGRSHWNGLEGLNSYSIGIEMDNAGRLTRVGSTYRASSLVCYGCNRELGLSADDIANKQQIGQPR